MLSLGFLRMVRVYGLKPLDEYLFIIALKSCTNQYSSVLDCWKNKFGVFSAD